MRDELPKMARHSKQKRGSIRRGFPDFIPGCALRRLRWGSRFFLCAAPYMEISCRSSIRVARRAERFFARSKWNVISGQWEIHKYLLNVSDIAGFLERRGGRNNVQMTFRKLICTKGARCRSAIRNADGSCAFFHKQPD